MTSYAKMRLRFCSRAVSGEVSNNIQVMASCYGGGGDGAEAANDGWNDSKKIRDMIAMINCHDKNNTELCVDFFHWPGDFEQSFELLNRELRLGRSWPF